ncbi:helix-turn-helix transcriptional regulator [Parasphingorhabdus sp.]|uniref:helix-turn-helix transcriptional regulator n=1 Tax=Parasphingorhabdus sp. TaxID=2709688 RepID=UPI002F940811
MKQGNSNIEQTRVLYTREHLYRLGVTQSASTLLRLEAKNRWPKRIRISDHSVAWLKSEVDSHIAELAASRGDKE